MIENSGFLSDTDELVQISASFSDVEILGRSVTNLYGCATRFGKRWFFKGVAQDSPDAAAARLRILNEIIDSVGYLHSQGIVHRDLKPANIMIRKNGGSSVIIDFGVADTASHLYQKALSNMMLKDVRLIMYSMIAFSKSVVLMRLLQALASL